MILGVFLAAPVSGIALAEPIVTASKCKNGKAGVQLGLPVLSGGSDCIANDGKSGGAIIVYLKAVLKLLSGLVGTVIMLMLVIAGIQYITSLGDPGRIKNAKTRITNALTGLVLFLMMYAILNFIVPGGIL